jgi:serine/threonine protein kinase
MMKLQIATDIAEGMNYLHTRDPPVIHADLKSPVLLRFLKLIFRMCCLTLP